jgi:hypothetical protein
MHWAWEYAELCTSCCNSANVRHALCMVALHMTATYVWCMDSVVGCGDKWTAFCEEYRGCCFLIQGFVRSCCRCIWRTLVRQCIAAWVNTLLCRTHVSARTCVCVSARACSPVRHECTQSVGPSIGHLRGILRIVHACQACLCTKPECDSGPGNCQCRQTADSLHELTCGRLEDCVKLPCGAGGRLLAAAHTTVWKLPGSQQGCGQAGARCACTRDSPNNVMPNTLLDSASMCYRPCLGILLSR